MHWKYFKSGNRNSSADFFVDCDSIIKLNDYYLNYTWHIGDNYRNYHRTGVYNHNSIGIEMCINNMDKMENVIRNTIVLVRELQKWLKIDKSNIFRHYDITHKWCPGTARNNVGLLLTKDKGISPGWLTFKNNLL
jgi:N-acetylmuramoyl-L-alanine amidase